MMRIWVHSTVKTATIGQSTMLSLVAHAALVGAAVYGTGVRAREVEQQISNQIYFRPPPDRRPSSDNLVERLQFMDLGRPAPIIGVKPDGEVQQAAVKPPKDEGGGDDGQELFSQAPAVNVESRDSVYSILEVEETAARTAGSAAPIYPPEMMKEGKEGRVYIQFIVDTTGYADPSSIAVIRATHPLFIESVKHAVPRMLFTPAMVGGRPVRQLVEQNFEFKIAVATPAEHTKAKRTP